jgi:hypothetical protein
MWRHAPWGNVLKGAVTGIIALIFLFGIIDDANTVEPQLTVSAPAEASTVPNSDSTFAVKGQVEPTEAEVRVNGENVTTNSNGAFDAAIDLQEGDNEVRVTAINGSKEDEYARVVTREPAEQEAVEEVAESEPEPSPEPDPEPEQQQAQQQQADEPQSNEPEAPQEQTVAIGEPLAVGEVAWLVTNAVTANQITQEEFGEFGETKQGNFVIVDFEFTNNSNESMTLDSASLALIDSQGRESEPDTDSFGYVPQNLDPFLKQVNPGVTEQGRVIFTVAPDASGFQLRLGDAAFFGAEEGYVNLGF